MAPDKLKIGNIDPLVGRHFVALSANKCRIQGMAEGAIRVYWENTPTIADVEEFNRFIEGILGPGLIATNCTDPRREAVKALARNVAPCGIRPQRGDAIVEIGGGPADRVRSHQGMAGGAVFAAPGNRARSDGARRDGRARGRRIGFLPGEDAAEQVS